MIKNGRNFGISQPIPLEENDLSLKKVKEGLNRMKGIYNELPEGYVCEPNALDELTKKNKYVVLYFDNSGIHESRLKKKRKN